MDGLPGLLLSDLPFDLPYIIPYFSKFVKSLIPVPSEQHLAGGIFKRDLVGEIGLP